MGFTIAYNWMWTPMCCANWATIKVATGSPIRGSSTPAPAAATATTPLTSPAAVPVEQTATAEEAK